MNTKLFFAGLLLSLPLLALAQDDMYFVPKKKSKTEKAQPTATNTAATAVRPYRTNRAAADTAVYYTGNLRDVDEYNRRSTTSGRRVTVIADTDTFEVDASRLSVDEKGNYILKPDYESETEAPLYDNDSEFAYSARLARFHGVGYPYYDWYDPWFYDPWYGPWHYTGWYYDPWHHHHSWYLGWGGCSPWYDPWYCGPGWHYPVGGWRPGGTIVASNRPHRGFNGGRGYGRTGSSSRGLAGTGRNTLTSGRGGGVTSRNTTTGRGTSRYGAESSSRGFRGTSSSSAGSRPTSSSSRGTYSGGSSRGSYSGSSSSRGTFSGGSSRGGFSSGGSTRGGGSMGGGSSRGGRR
ncbi:MAG: hypothetical protein K2H79_01075 [Bacteroidaceae bacterium]|nr:hypothetical protein [Bacteroidaceae bacterium]